MRCKLVHPGENRFDSSLLFCLPVHRFIATLLAAVQELVDKLYPQPSGSERAYAEPVYVEEGYEENVPLNPQPYAVETRFRRRSAVSRDNMEHPWAYSTPHDSSSEARVLLPSLHVDKHQRQYKDKACCRRLTFSDN